MKNALLLLLSIIVLSTGPIFALDITMDAERDDFYNALTGPADGYIYLSPASLGVGSGSGSPDDEFDCSGLVWFSWDSSYFYCYAEVTDELINVNSSTTYENDCIELKIDPDPLMESTSGVAAVRLTAWGEADAEVPDGVDNLIKGAELDEAWEPVEGEDYARKEVLTDTRYGYNLEFRLPFDVIVRAEKYVDVRIGGIMGLAVNLHDNDAGVRDFALRWGSDMDDTVWSDPQKHGTVTFLEGNKVNLSTANAITGVDTNSVDYTPPATGVATQPVQTPVQFELAQNYPNPFNPTTMINYSLAKAGHINVTIYSLSGQKVNTLVNEVQNSGVYSIPFDGSQLSSGVYLYQLQAGSQVFTRKMTLLR
ncbi:T9SS type A sorting domain-containing protein [candidate division KSB1 bacterium]|nr:T9SS type A sorting domain-containing protein [candidate division KSB1 bacterium]